ncbi:MAG: hypothetical protein KJ971_01970 [Firmicutes bacterium]|nr:hypothetical protein [Bacillota bacterium]
MEYIIAVLIVVAIVVIYVVSYAINEKTAVPKGCENLTDLSGCGACSNNGCSIKQTIDIEEHHVK